MNTVDLTLREAAEELGVSPRTIRRWIGMGKLPAELQPSRYGPQYAIAWEHIDAARDWVQEPPRQNVHEELIRGMFDIQTELGEIRRVIDEQTDRSQHLVEQLASVLEELHATREELHQLREQLLPDHH